MPRIARDARIETRDARTRLKVRKEPYWRQIHFGLSVGYYRGAHAAAWVVRRRVDSRYAFETLGAADDHQDANGLDVLSYAQACRKAMELADQAVTAPVERGYTVADACRDYLLWFRAHRKSYRDTERTVNAHILPALGAQGSEPDDGGSAPLAPRACGGPGQAPRQAGPCGPHRYRRDAGQEGHGEPNPDRAEGHVEHGLPRGEGIDRRSLGLRAPVPCGRGAEGPLSDRGRSRSG